MTQTSDQHAGDRPRDGTRKRLTIHDRLGLIGLIDEGMRSGAPASPIITDLFGDLWELVNATVSGSKIDRLKPEHSQNGFHSFEINAPTGENLCHLNMLYFRRPIPCYYLVYVEVSAPFRRKGLGTRILEYFRDFLIKKNAVGILDNIIPKDDPTFDIYSKQGWEPIEAVVGDDNGDTGGHYMVYLPSRFQRRALREPFLKLLYHLKRKRTVIDMRDNEVMVQRTIAEFKDLYATLLYYFEPEIEKGEASPLMRFMFTRFLTKFIAFRRRIGELIGYTGGESMEQIGLSPRIAAIPLQSYAPHEWPVQSSFVFGDAALWVRLPEAMKTHPTRFIESLPNYRRPSLMVWLAEKKMSPDDPLTLGDLMELGFDPTRLKEITIDEQSFIVERIQTRMLADLEKHKKLLERLGSEMPGYRVNNALIKVNPPLLAIRDRANAYIIRRKVNGIHHEEALEMIQSLPSMRELNAFMRIDRLVLSTVRQVKERVMTQADQDQKSPMTLLTFFVSWNLETNQPGLIIDPGGSFLESVWVA